MWVGAFSAAGKVCLRPLRVERPEAEGTEIARHETFRQRQLKSINERYGFTPGILSLML